MLGLLITTTFAYERGQRVQMMVKINDEWTDVASKVAPRFRERHSAKLDVTEVKIAGFEAPRGACVLDHDTTQVLGVHCEPGDSMSYSWRWRGDFDHDSPVVFVLVFIATICLTIIATKDAESEQKQADNVIHDHYRRGHHQEPISEQRTEERWPDISTLPSDSSADLAVYASSM